jgi:hypothetical protein
VLGCAEMDIFLSAINRNEGQSDMQNRKESITFNIYCVPLKERVVSNFTEHKNACLFEMTVCA